MEEELLFLQQLDRIKQNLADQIPKLNTVAEWYADAIESGGLIHVYANGHSRITVEEMVVRMGALTGFHPILSDSLTSFTDVLGASGIRINQFFEKIHGVGKELLKEVHIGPHDVLVVVTATGTTVAAIDIAIEFNDQYPDNSIVGLASAEQSSQATPKHNSGKNLHHVIGSANKGIFIDNGMPLGDLSVKYKGLTDTFEICPISSIGAITIVQALNELTIKTLDKRKIRHHTLGNMHLKNTRDNYNSWVMDQRKRYAKAVFNPDALKPKTDLHE